MKPNDKAYAAAIKIYNIHSDYDAESVSLRLAVDAAYAVQFQPSEDYAELVEKLRKGHVRYAAETQDEAAIRRNKERAEAADALEAVLAERDAMKAEIASAHTWIQMRATVFEELAMLRTERDAFLARLAPVDDEALVKATAQAICDYVYVSPDDKFEFQGIARAVIAAIRPHIEAAERERCAKIADKYEGEWHSDPAEDACARAIATEIRIWK